MIQMRGKNSNNIKLKAEMKTIADYALILQHCNGYPEKECLELASKSHGEPLFDKLLTRNTELFTTGDIIIKN